MTPAQIAKAARSRSKAGEALLTLMQCPPGERAALLSELDAEARAAWSERLAESLHLWEELYQAVLAGLLPLPEAPAFAFGMLGGLRSFNRPPCARGMTLPDRLRACPELCEHVVWRLFELGNASKTSLAGHGRGWDDALVELSRTGELSRQRLLDASLDALARDFSKHEAGWFARFHETLAPTPDERGARAGSYLALLTSLNAPTVSFALAALKLTPMNRDTAARLVAPSSAALRGASKTAAKGVLGLLAAATKLDPKLEPRVARCAVEALYHDAVDVQSAAWKLVSQHGARDDAELSESVRNALPHVAPSLSETVATWVGEPPAGVSHVPVEAATLPAHPLDAANALAPIETVAELCERASAVLEAGSDGVELELVVDGIARLHAVDDTARQRMGPALAELARRRRQALSPPAPFDGTSPTQDVRTLILSWLEGMAVPSVRRTAPVVKTMWVSEHRRSRQDQLMQGRGLHEHGRGLLAAFSSRVHAVARNVLLGRTREPLATPTHRRGYLCPMVFAERLRRADAIEPIDLAQALLRLGDEGRDRALELLSETPIAAATYARWALGGPDEPAPDPLLLAAASAARSIPEVRWKLRTAQRRYENRNVGGFRDAFTTVELRADPAPEGIAAGSLVAALLDTSQVIDGPSDYEAVTPSLVASMWPAFPDATYARAARLIADDYDEGRHHALASFVERLIEPGPELREVGATLLGVALAAPSSDVRALGVEALATALAGGRLGEQARAQLGALLETQVIVTSRWVAGLKSAAARSSRHRAQARELIESWMATGVAAHFDRDLGALLELVYQSAVKDEARVVDPRALRFLASVEGKSAAARTARKLREL